MKDKKLISIIMPAYNVANVVEETIASVMNQTYKNWELIIVDDGSSDGTVEKIKKLQTKEIKLIALEKNGGAAKARNRGIEVSAGEYIAFIDADDLWMPDKLAKQVEFMKKNEAEFIFSAYEFANEKGVPNGKIVHVPATINREKALLNTTIWTSTVMFDMNKLSKEDVSMPNIESEDTATWWKVLKKVDVAYGMDEVLAIYRRSKKTLSSNKLKAIRRIWNLYRKYEKMNVLESLGNFVGYAFNAVRRRV